MRADVPHFLRVEVMQGGVRLSGSGPSAEQALEAISQQGKMTVIHVERGEEQKAVGVTLTWENRPGRTV